MTPRPVPLKCRLAFYSLVLAFAVFQTVFTGFGIANGEAPLMAEFSYAGIGLSAITWSWVSVLLAFTNRPSSKHILAQNNVHLLSFAIFSVVWLAMGIMFATQAHYTCTTPETDSMPGFWCAFDTISTTFSFVIFTFAACAFITIYLPRRRDSGYSNINVAAHDTAQRVA